MKNFIFLLIFLIVGICVWVGTGKSYHAEEKKTYLKVPSSAHYSAEEIHQIEEMKRLYDTIDKYGFEEGVRKYNLDTLNISDEELQAIKEAAHEIAVKYGHLLNDGERRFFY